MLGRWRVVVVETQPTKDTIGSPRCFTFWFKQQAHDFARGEDKHPTKFSYVFDGDVICCSSHGAAIWKPVGRNGQGQRFGQGIHAPRREPRSPREPS